GAGHQLARRPTRLATGLHSPLRRSGRVVPAGVTVATHLTADGRGRAVDQAGDPAQAEALGMTDLNGGAFFNAEFGIGHRGNTVPERSGVALSFCGRPFFGINHLFIPLHGSLSVSSTRFSLVALRYYSAFFMSTHKKPDLNPSRSGFLSHLALLQRRIIDIPLRPLTIEGREIRLVERRVLCEA